MRAISTLHQLSKRPSCTDLQDVMQTRLMQQGSSAEYMHHDSAAAIIQGRTLDASTYLYVSMTVAPPKRAMATASADIHHPACSSTYIVAHFDEAAHCSSLWLKFFIFSIILHRMAMSNSPNLDDGHASHWTRKNKLC